MKKSVHNRILHAKKGETLIEGVISTLVFALLMLALTTMITAAANINREAIQQNASWYNDKFNPAVRLDFATTQDIIITFEAPDILANQPVKAWVEEDFAVFYPVK